MDYSPWNSPGQNTGVGSLFLLQGIFPTQGSNPGIEPRSPALWADSLPAEPQGNLLANPRDSTFKIVSESDDSHHLHTTILVQPRLITVCVIVNSLQNPQIIIIAS